MGENNNSGNGMNDLYSRMAEKLEGNRRDRFENASKVVTDNMERLNLSEVNAQINRVREDSVAAAEKNNEYEPPALRNPKSKLLTFAMCIGVMLVVLAIQLVIGLPVGEIISRQAKDEVIMNSTSDLAGRVEEYTEIFMNRYSEAMGWITLLVTVVSMLVGIVWYLKRFIGRDYKKSLNGALKKIRKPRMIGICVLLGLGCQFLMGIVASLENLIMSESLIQGYEETFNMNGLYSFWGILAIVVAAPINEEVFFRGIILNKMRNTGARAGAVLTAALLFSLMHMIPYQVIYTIPAGLILAYVGYRYKSIWPTMIIHAIANGSNFLVSFISEKVSDKLGAGVDFGLTLLLAVTCVFGAVLLMKQEKAEETEETENTQDTQRTNRIENAQETGQTEDTQETQETGQTEDTQEMQETEKAEETEKIE